MAAAALRRRPAPELRPAPSRQALLPGPDAAEVGERGGDGPEVQRRRRQQRQPAARAAPVAVARAGGRGEAGGRGRQQRGPRGAAGARLGGAVGSPAVGNDAGGRELPAQRRRRRARPGAGAGRRRRRGGAARRGGRMVGRARGVRRHRARPVPLLKNKHRYPDFVKRKATESPTETRVTTVHVHPGRSSTHACSLKKFTRFVERIICILVLL